MAGIVGIVSRHGLRIEMHCRSQPNKSYFYSQLYISNKMERLSYKGVCGVCGSTHIEAFKEEVAWATDKRLRVISNIMLFKTVIPLRN